MAFKDYYKKKGEDVKDPYEDIAVPEYVEPQRVDMSWWKSPNYVAAERAAQEEEKAMMQQQERRAKNEKNAALLGDIARLGAQVWASKGGAWDIRPTQPFSAVRQERLQAIRDKNAALQVQFAQRLRQAKMADDKDAMDKEKVRATLQQKADKAAQDYNAAVLQQRVEMAKANQVNDREERKLEELKRNHQAMEKAAMTRANNVGGKKFIVKINGVEREYLRDNIGIIEAYNDIVNIDPTLIAVGEPILNKLNEVIGHKPPTIGQMMETIRRAEAGEGQPSSTQLGPVLPINHSSVLRDMEKGKKAYGVKTKKGKGY